MTRTIARSLILMALSAPLAAAEVVQFKDGRHTVVQGHRIVETWLRLDVDRESWYAIPLDRVASIRIAGDDRFTYRASRGIDQATDDHPSIRVRTVERTERQAPIPLYLRGRRLEAVYTARALPPPGR